VRSHLETYDSQRHASIELTSYNHFGCAITSPRVSRFSGRAEPLPDTRGAPVNIADASADAFVAFPKPWQMFGRWLADDADTRLYRVPGALTNRLPDTLAYLWRKMLIRWSIETGRYLTYSNLPDGLALATLMNGFDAPDPDNLDDEDRPMSDRLLTRKYASSDAANPSQIKLTVRCDCEVLTVVVVTDL
jgi:hypothetical protein